jgi:hypothetical protein
MAKYMVRVEFYVEIEAEDEERAEDIGWDWDVPIPQAEGFYMAEKIQPSMVDVEGLSSELDHSRD